MFCGIVDSNGLSGKIGIDRYLSRIIYEIMERRRGNLNTDGTPNTLNTPSGNTHTANTIHQLPVNGNGSSPTNQS